MSWLDRTVVASGVGGAVCLCFIGVIIAGQIVARLFGYQIVAADDFAAWALAGSIFLALPYAMLRGDHIRVTLLLQFLPTKAVRPYEVLATAIGFALSAWGTWSALAFVYESYVYKEMSQGMLSLPLWPVQVCMPVGLALLSAVLGRRLVACLRGDVLEETR